MDFFKNLPTNENKVYITGTLDGGCQLFVPCKYDNKFEIGKTKTRLTKFIAEQKVINEEM